MAVARHVAAEHADLALGDLARRALILPADTARSLALLQEAGLIDHEDRIVIGQRFKRIITHDIAQIVGIPPATALKWPADARGRDRRQPRLASSPSCGVPLRSDDAQSSSVASIDAPAIPRPPHHGHPWIQNSRTNATVMLGCPLPPQALNRYRDIASAARSGRRPTHELPKGFHRIRHYGLLDNGNRAAMSPKSETGSPWCRASRSHPSLLRRAGLKGPARSPTAVIPRMRASTDG